MRKTIASQKDYECFEIYKAHLVHPLPIIAKTLSYSTKELSKMSKDMTSLDS